MSNTFTWNTTNGDWSIGSNWTDITSITPGPPTGADVADFFNLSGTVGSAGTITGTGTAAVVNFVGTPVWTLAGNFSTTQGFVAPGAGTTADVAVQSGVWTLSNGIHIGEQGAGTVTVDSGATISTGGTFDVVGDVAGSTGQLVINSGGTFVSTAPSVSGNYLLDIGDQGASGTLAPASGYVLVNGGLLNLNGTGTLDYSGLSLGLNGGNGTLTVQNGGSVAVGTANSSSSDALAVGKRGSGTVTVTGTGSSLTAAGGTYLGRGGGATLLVENDAIVQIGTDPTGAGGFEVGRGSINTGEPTGGTGNATIESGGSLFSSQEIYVGGVGVTGSMTVNAGTVEAGTRLLVGLAAVVSGTTEVGSGTVNIGPGGVVKIDGNGITASGTSGLSIGTYTGSTATGGATGTVNVSGAGAFLNVGSHFINIGATGTGALTVSSGGSVLAGTQFGADAATNIGGESGVGTLTVTDTDSTYNAVGQLNVGAGGTGSLLIENGGSVFTGNNTVFAQGGFVIGHDGGSTGSVTVTGAGSELVNIGQFNVGGSGNSGSPQGGVGTLLISAGGSVSSNLPASGYTGPVGDIAADPGTGGSSVTVTGTNSTWTLGGDLIVGGMAAGSLSVLNGGTTTADQVDIGDQSGASGFVDVAGTNSQLDVTGAVGVGEAGQGIMTIAAGGLVAIGGGNDLDIGGSGGMPGAGGLGTVAVQSGGTLDATGTAFVWSGSTLSVDSSSAVDIGTSGSFDAGNILVESGHTLVGNGLISAAVTNDGDIEASNSIASGQPLPGTLEITGNVAGTGTINIDRSGILKFDGLVASSQTINFATGGAEMILSNPPGTFTAAIDNLNVGDRIEFGSGVVITGVSVTSPGTVTVVTNTGSIVLNDVSFATGANQSFFWFQDASTDDWTIQVAPAFLNWTGTVSTDLGTAGNWSPPGPPNSSESITFSNGGGTLTGSASALSFQISGSGTFDFEGATLDIAGQPSPPYLPYAGQFSADTVLDGAALNAAGGTTNISASGGVTVTDEGTSSVTTLGDSVGVNAGESGSLVLTGLATIWTEQRNPALELNGFLSGFLTIGQNSGSTGTLSVSNGATLTTQNFALLGNSAGADGYATVSNVGNWNAGSFNIGNRGSGTVTINSFGTVSTSGTFNDVGGQAGSTGELVINSGGTFVSTAPSVSGDYVLYIGDQGASGALAPASGYVLVNGGLLNLNGSGTSDYNGLSLGQDGGSGTLTVQNGGSVAVGTPNSSIGPALGVGKHGSGIVTVTGTGSSLTAAGFAYFGRGGNATLLVQNDAIVQIGTDPTGAGGLDIGTGLASGPPTGGTGSATIESGGSLSSVQNINVGGGGVTGTLTVNSGSVEADARLLVGLGAVVSGTTEGGSGIVNIGPGGVVNIEGNGITATGTSGLSIATYEGSITNGAASGTVDVDGGFLNSGSDYINIGVYGTGELTVSDAGTVIAGTLLAGNAATYIGAHPGADGALTVSDPNSLFQAQGQMIVGDAGAGSLSVLNGGTTTADQVDIGDQAGASGSVDVDGTNSQLNVSGALNIGDSGSADLTVGTGGSVSAGSGSVGTLGTLALAGGTFDPAGPLVNSGIIAGFGTLDDAVNNSSTIIAESGELDIKGGPISGSGDLTIAADSTLNAAGLVNTGQSVTFGGSDATLILGTPGSGFSNAIDNLQDFDRIELAGISISGAVFTPGSTADVGSITVSGSETYIFNDVTFASDASTDLLTGFDSTTGNDYIQVACYLEGTHILTDKGEAPVESLAIGDNVITRSGKPQPIKWIGRRSYDGAFAAANPTLAPVLIRAGALADSIPHRDLYVSPEHAMYIDGVLVPARHLVNGTSILATRDIDPIRYFHIELAAHDVIYAEGAAAETFVDCDSRNMFHNAAEYAQLYPDAQQTKARFCAKVVERGRKLVAINKRLAARAASIGLGATNTGPLDGYIDYAEHAGIAGWAWCKTQPDTPVRLEILAGDKVIGTVLADQLRADLKDAGIGDGRHGFELRFTRPLDPFLRYEITIRRAIGHGRLAVEPIVIEPAERLDEPAREAVASLLRHATARAESIVEAEALHHLLLAEARQAQLTRLRLLRRQGAIERRRGAVPTPARRALVIDETWPRTDHDAGSQAVISHMQALQRRRWHVSFTATAPLGDNAIPKAALEALGITCHAAPEVGSVEELLRDAADQYQLVYLHRLPVASAYAGLVRRYQPGARLIYSVADLHHLRVARQAAVEARPELARRASVLRRQELLAVQQADAVITHSPVEAGMLAREVPGAQVQVVPWAVRPGPAPRPWASRHGILLVANFAHEPNADGLLWFVREVMPLLWSNAPELTLTVAGAGLASGIARTLTDARVKLLGHVPDLRPLLASARLAVAPLRFGAGIKGKVLEAWAAGLPCAMTPIAAEGLPLDATLAGSVAADAEALARVILALHIDPAHNATLSRAGRAVLRRHFSQKRLDAALAEALLRPPASVHSIRSGRAVLPAAAA